MNVTKEVIHDLFPLYLSNECSADTRALVEEYLRANPAEAEALRRVMSAPLPASAAPANGSEEVRALIEARRRVRQRSWTMAVAIFFTVAPFSFFYDGKTFWMLFWNEPKAAAAYWAVGVVAWVVYFVQRGRQRAL